MDKPLCKVTITLQDQADGAQPLIFVHYHQDLSFELPSTPAEQLADMLVKALNGYAVIMSKAPATPMDGVDIDAAHHKHTAMPIQMFGDET